MAKVSELPSEALIYWSRIVYQQYQPISVLRQFATVKRDLTVQPGKTIGITKRDNLGLGKRLTDEYDKIPTTKMSKSYSFITVHEVGNSTETTEFVNSVGWQDDLAEISDALGINYAETLEAHFVEALNETANEIFGDGKTDITTIAATDTLSKAIIEEGQYQLKALKAPGFPRVGTQRIYIAYINIHQLRELRNDPEFQEVSKYTNAGVENYLFRGEVGRYQNIVFIENPDLEVIPAGEQGNAVDVYVGYLFGMRALGYAESMPLEVRQDPAQDMGRIIRIGWLSVYGTGLINDHVIKLYTA